jgi:hypothetical protein
MPTPKDQQTPSVGTVDDERFWTITPSASAPGDFDPGFSPRNDRGIPYLTIAFEPVETTIRTILLTSNNDDVLTLNVRLTYTTSQPKAETYTLVDDLQQLTTDKKTSVSLPEGVSKIRLYVVASDVISIKVALEKACEGNLY